MASQSEQTGRFHAVKRANGPSTWIALAAVAITVLLAARVWFQDDGKLLAQVTQNTGDIKNTRGELGDMDDAFVPRREIDLKLQTIQLQVEQVAGDVEELKQQSERQTAEIIRKIERLDTPRRTP